MTTQLNDRIPEAIELSRSFDRHGPFSPEQLIKPESHIPADELEPGVVYVVDGIASDDRACLTIVTYFSDTAPYIRSREAAVQLIGAELEYVGYKVDRCETCGDSTPHHEFRLLPDDADPFAVATLSTIEPWFYAQSTVE